MMDGIEIQDQQSQNGGPITGPTGNQDVSQTKLIYPLPMDQKLVQGDAFRGSSLKLRSQLQQIDEFYSSSEAKPHTGPPDCSRCTEKKAKISQAFTEYYLATEPGTWSLDFPGVRELLEQSLKDGIGNLKDVHTLFQTGLKSHLKNDLCTPHPQDDPTSTSLKKLTTDMYKNDAPLSNILKFYISELEARAPSPEAAQFLVALQATKTPEERAPLYIQYYCSPDPQDPPVLRNFKQKYARMFEALVPHDEVLSSMKKEANEFQKSKLGTFKSQLSELQMAQNAHLKNKQKKLDRTQGGHGDTRDQMVECTLEGCMAEINLMTGEIIECVICEWLASKGGQNGDRRERAAYCSVEHAESDFESHDQVAHACIMGERCINYPATGPSTASSSGLCNNCSSHGFISYFCSSECHHHNYDLHRDDFMRRDIGIHNDDDSLEVFRPASDLEIIELGAYDREREEEGHEDYVDGELEEGERMDDS